MVFFVADSSPREERLTALGSYITASTDRATTSVSCLDWELTGRLSSLVCPHHPMWCQFIGYIITNSNRIIELAKNQVG